MKQAVLLDDRPVEPELLAQILDLLLAGAGAERQAGRVAGDAAGDREDHDRQARPAPAATTGFAE